MPSSSLYPWHYQIRWPFYFMFPSTRNRTGLQGRPLRHVFSPEALSDSAKICFLGDIMVMHDDRIPRIDPALRALLRDADLLIGNCESPVLPRDLRAKVHYGFVFDMAETFLRGVLDQLGVHPDRIALSVANNHSGDQGKAALGTTVECFQRLGITPLGVWSATEPPVTHLVRGGLRIGVAAWTRWMNAEVFEDTPGVWRTQHVETFDFAEHQRREALDLVIAFPHWEYEFQHFPHRETRTLARRLNERGVRLIAGCHTHVLQPIEWFDDGICAYSVGNFCGQGVAWPVRLIPLLEVRIGRSGEHRGRVVAYETHLFFQRHEGQTISIVPFEEAPLWRRLRMRMRVRHLGAPGAPTRPQGQPRSRC